MNDKVMTKEEMRGKLEKNRAKVKKSIGFDDDIEDYELPPGPHFSPANEVDLQRRKNEIKGKE
jgi:hypothetical protein